MLAAVVAAPNQVRLEKVPIPVPGDGEVLVRLEGCGVCGSNLAPWEGRPWFKYPLNPGELGHEGWGRVDALGSSVSQFKKGDRVALLSYRAYAEFDVAPECAVVPLPAELAEKPFPGEGMGCAMNVFRRCDVQPGQTVAIVGIGFLGAVLTGLCAKAGARVIAISRRPFALETARELGAAETISFVEPSYVTEQAKELTGGRFCERVIEAVGMQGALALASELTAERGRLIIAGYHQDGLRQVNLQLWNWRGLDVINAHERDTRIYVQGIKEAVEAVANGRLNPFNLFTHSFQLERLGSALDAMRERPPSFLKALVKV